MNMLIDFFPLILFFIAYSVKGIYAALVVLMIAMPIGLLVKYLRSGLLDKMYMWSTIVLFVVGALAFYFQNILFFMWKPTVFYWAIAVVFVGSQFLSDKPLSQRLYGLVDGLSYEKMTRKDWLKLNYAWALFSVAAGILNIYVAYNFEEATWVNFKVFGLTALTFVFLLGQTLWISQFIDDEDADTREEQD